MENKETLTSADSRSSAPAELSVPYADDLSEEPKLPSPSIRAPQGSSARSSISSDQSSLTHGSSPRPASPQGSPLGNMPGKPPSPVVVADHPSTKDGPAVLVNRSVREEPMVIMKTDRPGREGIAEEGIGGTSRRRLRESLSILRRVKRDIMIKRAALGFRVFGCLFCLVSFSVLAADRNQGWALDSFERYKEFRYCVSVNVIGFVYSGAQAINLILHLATGKYAGKQPTRSYFDFATDQIVAYLLISASSSAVTRIDDWQSNWGMDKFPNMASASVSMSFLAFVTLAFSSLISGYAVFTFKSP